MTTAPPLPAISAGLHEDLLAWYAAYARDLPWRRTTDPYAILVAEVMLQQTQVDRVAPKYDEFLAAFPTLEALARATTGDVIRLWTPLGYNGRAVRLHRLAQQVVEEHGGTLPRDLTGLRRLPGLGPYTAAAVACFAFGAVVPVLDTNVYRVLSRVAFGVEPPAKGVLAALAERWLPEKGAPECHQALMDVGATLCTVTRPRCALCPLRPHCKAAPYLQGGGQRKLAEASVPYTPKQAPFAGSSRYYRGRVVEALRQLPVGADMGLAELGRRVRPEFDPTKNSEWLRQLIAGLERDGLVKVHHRDDGSFGVSLP